MQLHLGAIVGMLVAAGTGSPEARALVQPPDFSGTWATDASDAPRSPLGARFSVTQDASTITLTTAREQVTYTLDDSENVRTTRTASGATWRRSSRARFVSFALVVTTLIDAGLTGQWEDLFVVSLDRPGEMTVVLCETVKSMDPGMSTRVLKYRKQ